MLAVGGTFTVTVKVPVAPGNSVPKLQLTAPVLPAPGWVQTPPLGLTALKVVLTLLPVIGSTALTTVPVVATGELLVSLEYEVLR